MTTGTQREYAEHRGCSEAYVSKLKREGKLVLTAAGKVDFEATDKLLLAASDPDKEGVRDRWRRERGKNSNPELTSSREGFESHAGGGHKPPPLAFQNPDQEQPTGEADAFPGAGDKEPPPESANRALYDERLRVQIRTARLDEDMKRLDLLEQAGELIKVSTVSERMFAYGRQVRDLFLAIPARVQADLAAETDPMTIGSRLIDEIKATLNEIERRVAAESRVKRGTGQPEPAG